jgi:hypothetical protein
MPPKLLNNISGNLVNILFYHLDTIKTMNSILMLVEIHNLF